MLKEQQALSSGRNRRPEERRDGDMREHKESYKTDNLYDVAWEKRKRMRNLFLKWEDFHVFMQTHCNGRKCVRSK